MHWNHNKLSTKDLSLPLKTPMGSLDSPTMDCLPPGADKSETWVMQAHATLHDSSSYYELPQNLGSVSHKHNLLVAIQQRPSNFTTWKLMLGHGCDMLGWNKILWDSLGTTNPWKCTSHVFHVGKDIYALCFWDWTGAGRNESFG